MPVIFICPFDPESRYLDILIIEYGDHRPVALCKIDRLYAVCGKEIYPLVGGSVSSDIVIVGLLAHDDVARGTAYDVCLKAVLSVERQDISAYIFASFSISFMR